MCVHSYKIFQYITLMGASLSTPHIVMLSRISVRPSVHPVGVCPTSGVRLAYDCIIVILRRPRAGSTTRVQVTILHDSTESSLLRLRRCYKLRTTDLLRAAEVS